MAWGNAIGLVLDGTYVVVQCLSWLLLFGCISMRCIQYSVAKNKVIVRAEEATFSEKL